MNRSILLICLLVLLYSNAGALRRRNSSSLKPRITGDLRPRITGGSVASINRFPYLVSLRNDGTHVCGAVIIRRRTILTAGHCVDRLQASSLTIRAGSNFRERGGTIYRVSGIRRHPRFNRQTLNFDIAMLYLNAPLQYSSRVRPIQLFAQPLRGNMQGVISGWGTRTEDGELSNRLRSTRIRVLPRTRCRRGFGQELTRTMFCAGRLRGGRDSCQGDSGGPFVINGRLAGIVSLGNGCGRRGFPGLYTKVPLLRSWINNNARN